jgi:hypothetical protein
VATKLSDEEARRLDVMRGPLRRADFLRVLIDQAWQVREPGPVAAVVPGAPVPMTEQPLG